MLPLQADAQRGTVYDEMYVDDQALYELILNTFYNEVSAGRIQSDAGDRKGKCKAGQKK